MKRILFSLLLILASAQLVNAQVCKISGTNDNVEVFSAALQKPNTVKVVVSNDSKDISANVTVTINVKYGSYEEKYSGKCLALPNQSSEIIISIRERMYNSEATDVEVISITGAKCIN